MWPDAVGLPDDVLLRLLQAAQEQAEAYAPALAFGDAVPARYTEALILQARELWGATRREGADVVGFDTYAVRVRPLSATVRSLLRPPPGAVRVR